MQGHCRERKKMVLSGCSFLRRLTRVISVPTAQTVPAGASRTVFIIYSVEAERSDNATTSLRHSGWTMIWISGYLSRKYSTCLGRNSMWTLQNPFQRIIFALFIASLLFPPIGSSLCHTIISSSGMPILKALFLPRCSSGKKKTFSLCPKAHRITLSAIEDVQTAPFFLPQKALRPAEEVL